MCVNCGNNGCSCDPANIRIPVGPTGPLGPTGPSGPIGNPGADGRGIVSSSYDPLTGVVTFTFSDGTTYLTGDLRGADGADGNPSAGIAGDVLTSLDVTYNNYNDFVGTELALWLNKMNPLGKVEHFYLSTANFDASGYGKDLSGSGGSNMLGWAICDGNTKTKSDGSGTLATPDLRGRFIAGYSTTDSDFTHLAQGGTKNHTHDSILLNTNNIPEHTHSTTGVTVGAHTHSLTAVTIGGGAHGHTILADQDGGSGGSKGMRLTNDPPSAYDAGAQGWIYGGAHTHTISGNTDGASSNTLVGNVDVNNTSESAFDTPEATNTNAESNALPPYYALIPVIKI